LDDLTEWLEVGGDIEVGKTKGVVKNVLKCVEGTDKGILFLLLRRGREGGRETERGRENTVTESGTSLHRALKCQYVIFKNY
jgi:hypothetical protein